jgi:hypothetical protein
MINNLFSKLSIDSCPSQRHQTVHQILYHCYYLYHLLNQFYLPLQCLLILQIVILAALKSAGSYDIHRKSAIDIMMASA